MAPRLVVVSHTKSGGTARLLDAVLRGAHDPAIDGVDVRSLEALDATTDDVMQSDGIILATPANFGYMSGALKHFFDTVYHDVLEHTRGLPYALVVKASTDGSGAVAAVEPLATGLGWRAIADPIVVEGEITDAHLEACAELGATMAAGLAYGGL